MAENDTTAPERAETITSDSSVSNSSSEKMLSDVRDSQSQAETKTETKSPNDQSSVTQHGFPEVDFTDSKEKGAGAGDNTKNQAKNNSEGALAPTGLSLGGQGGPSVMSSEPHMMKAAPTMFPKVTAQMVQDFNKDAATNMMSSKTSKPDDARIGYSGSAMASSKTVVRDAATNMMPSNTSKPDDAGIGNSGSDMASASSKTFIRRRR